MSKFCNNCGAEIRDDSMMFCPDCGARQDSSLGQQASGGFDTAQPYNQGYQQNTYSAPPQYGAQPMYNAQPTFVQPANNVTSIGGWIGWMILCSCLPIIGAIIVICVAKDESLKNWAKAYFVMLAIGVILFIICGASIFSTISSIAGYAALMSIL